MTLESPFAGDSVAVRRYGPSTSAGPVDVETFMAGIRRLESGSFQGDYGAIGRWVRGDRAIGAYQIMSRYWADWAAAAGIPGADWRDPAAQDHVARHVMTRYYQRFGNWDLVALAWYAGASTAQRVAQRGYEGPESINHDGIRQYVTEVKGYVGEAQSRGIIPKQAYGPQPTMYQSSNQWMFPVAGPATWSRGSWMPNERTHRGRFHPAIDIYAEAGTPIVSPVGGVVEQTRKSKLGGNTVRVRGDDGHVYYFAHMAEAAVVGAGQRINAGQHLGFVGNSGSAKTTSPHLHFSITKQGGREVNPASFLESATMGGGAFPSYDPSMWSESMQSLQKLEPGVAPPEGNRKRAAFLTGMLQTISDKVAGGTRDPSVYQQYGMTDSEEQERQVETP